MSQLRKDLLPLAATNKCLARDNKSRAREKATKERERLKRAGRAAALVTTAMKIRLALALLAAMVTVLPASGAADRGTSSGAQRSRQPHGLRAPGFHAPSPPAPHPDVRPPPYGSPGGSFLPLPLPYQRPWVN